MGLAASYLRGLLPRPSTVDLPDLVRHRDGVRIDPAHLLRYSRVCGYTVSGAVPPTYPHLLGFAPSLALMADRRFPFRLPGLVHLRQEIAWYQPIAVDDTLDVEVSAERLAPHRRGATVDMVTRIRCGTDEVWLGRSTYLSRGATPPPGEPPAEESTVDDEPVPVCASWRLPAGLGRRYAAVSGDRNPIHLSAVTARLFGFRYPIAHGMWSAARCLAALAGRLPERGAAQVWFRRPVRLPGRVGFGTRTDADGTAFRLTDPSGRVLLAGHVG